MKINIDVYTNPKMKEATRTIGKIESENQANLFNCAIEDKFVKNEVISFIENYLVTLGICPNLEAAYEQNHQLSDDRTSLLLKDDEGTTTRTLKLADHKELETAIMGYCGTIEKMQAEEEVRSEALNTRKQAAWGLIYEELVTLGHFPDVATAKENDFTLFDRRFLRLQKDGKKSHPILDALRDLVEG